MHILEQIAKARLTAIDMPEPKRIVRKAEVHSDLRHRTIKDINQLRWQSYKNRLLKAPLYFFSAGTATFKVRHTHQRLDNFEKKIRKSPKRLWKC